MTVSGVGASDGHPTFRRVLVVEDNVVSRKVAVAMLRASGYEVDWAEDGFEALRMLRSETYDVVFMDLEMPGMDGPTTTREIRRDRPDAVRPRIIGLTAAHADERRRAGIDAGMSACISKPLTREKIALVLESDGDVRPVTTRRESGDAIEAPVVDGERLHALITATGSEFFARLVDEYVQESESLLATMVAAAERGDAAALASAAHSEAAASAQFAAMELARTCSALERLGKEGDLGPTPRLAEHARRQFDIVRDALVSLATNDAQGPVRG